MTKKQETELRVSEIRERLSTINGLPAEERTAEIKAERDTLIVDYAEAEREFRSAVIAEENDPSVVSVSKADAETRERIELRNRASVGAFLSAALQGRLPSGAEAEFGAAVNAPAGQIPIGMFERDRPVEARAVTPAPATGTGVTVAPVQPFVFAPSIAPRLGIEMPSVPSGGYSEMTISTGLMVNPEPKGDPADGTAGALTSVTANPRRISARLSLAIEDIAMVGQANFEAALRMHVSMALSNSLDNQIINGNGAAPNINGIINQLTDPANPAAIATFDAFIDSFADQIDGLWASMMGDVSIVANVDVLKLAAKTFRGTAANGGPAITAADYLKAAAGGFWTNKRMPATAATIARGIVHRMGRMGLRTACLPTWGSVAIDDIYTDSAKGERHFTLHILVGDKVLLVQPAAYGMVEYKVA